MIRALSLVVHQLPTLSLLEALPAMPSRNMTGGDHPAGAPMLSMERASSPVRLESAAPQFRNTTAAIYPAKPGRQEPSKAANRPVSAAFCDVPDPRFARLESMQSQIEIGAASEVASVASSDLGGGSPKVGTTVRVATAEDLQSGKPRRRVAARSRSSRASASGGASGGAAGEDDARSVRSYESGSVRSYYSEGGGSQRSRSSYAPSQVSNASTASTILRARVAELERENAALKDRPAPGRGDHGVWQAGEPVASGIMRRADLFASDRGAFVHEGQSASAEERGRTTHQEGTAVGYFPDTPPEVFEAKIAAKFEAAEKQLKNRHLSSSIQLAHDDGGGAGGASGHSPREALVARRSTANPEWQGGTPPQQRGGGAASPDRRAGASSDSMGSEKIGIERPSADAKGLRRALDNTSQFTIGAATGGGGVDVYQVAPVATKKSVESQPALLASGPRWASTLRDAPGAGSDAFQQSMSNGRGR